MAPTRRRRKEVGRPLPFLRRGGGQQRLDIQAFDIAVETEDDQLLAVHEALDQFAVLDKPKAELVKLRYFVGLTIEESAEILGISLPTAKRHWTYARAWLHREIEATRASEGTA